MTPKFTTSVRFLSSSPDHKISRLQTTPVQHVHKNSLSSHPHITPNNFFPYDFYYHPVSQAETWSLLSRAHIQEMTKSCHYVSTYGLFIAKCSLCITRTITVWWIKDEVKVLKFKKNLSVIGFKIKIVLVKETWLVLPNRVESLKEWKTYKRVSDLIRRFQVILKPPEGKKSIFSRVSSSFNNCLDCTTLYLYGAFTITCVILHIAPAGQIQMIYFVLGNIYF